MLADHLRAELLSGAGSTPLALSWMPPEYRQSLGMEFGYFMTTSQPRPQYLTAMNSNFYAHIQIGPF